MPVVRLQCERTLPTEIVTLLVPVVDGQSNLGMLVRAHNGDAAPVSYQYNVGTEEHRFFFAGGRPWTMGSWSSDAEFLYCQSESDLKEIAFCSGSYVEFAGQRLVSSERRIESAELEAYGTTARTLGPNAELNVLPTWPQSTKESDASNLGSAPNVQETEN